MICQSGQVMYRPRQNSIAKVSIFLMALLWLVIATVANAQTVTLTVKNAPIKEVLQQVQKQTGYNIMMDEKLLEKAAPVTMQVKDASVEEVLRMFLKQDQFSYKIEDRNIIVRKPAAAAPQNYNSGGAGKAPEVVVKGKVTDDEFKALSNVSVYNSTSKRGTVTNEEGAFTLKANTGDMLQISYVGFTTKQVKVTAGQDMLSIILNRKMDPVDDVVITGYQSVQRSKMAGSVARVKAEDLLLNGATTIEKSLQGMLAGVDVASTSGMVGTRQTVRVRGVSTLLGNQEPVWVVDNIIQEDPLPFQAKELNRFNQEPSNSEQLKNFIGSAISWLNPFDIEDVTVLKDAASTAIYGVKAANGVILITTKRGKAGRPPSVSYNGSFSTQTPLNYDKLNLMNSKERVDVSREIWERGLTSTSVLDNVGYSGLLKQYLDKSITFEQFNEGAKQLEVNNTNWFDYLYQRPLSSAHGVSVSGGGANNTYYASLGVNMQKGQAIGNGQNAYMASVGFTSNITPKLLFGIKVSANYSKTDGFFNFDPYRYATSTSRVIPAYNPDGSLHYYNFWNTGLRYNVINEREQSGNTNVKSGMNNALNLRYKFSNSINFESVLGVNFSNVTSEAYATEFSHAMTVIRGYEYGSFGPNDLRFQQSRLPFGGTRTTITNNNVNYTWRNGLNYGRTFNKVHAVTGLVGLEARSNIYKALQATNFGYLHNFGRVIAPPPPLITGGAGQAIANSLYQTNQINSSIVDRVANTMSYYATGAYSYDNRYAVNLSIRGDASNRFGQDERTKFKPVWAAGARWNIGNEKFFDKSSWLNDLSLRATYGYQGNVAENFGPDLILSVPTGSNAINNLTGETIYRISRMPYSNLRWEKTQTVNLGLDFNFLQGRISASVDYFNKRSRDLIVNKDVPYENGVIQMPVNNGTLFNSGVDLSMNFIPVRTKNFTWSIGITATRTVNKVTSPQIQNPTWNTAKSGTYFVNGYAASSFWAFDFIGLDSATGVPRFNLPTPAQDPNAKFDAAAFMKYAGKLNPDFTGGFNLGLRYKTLSLSSLLYLSLGGSKILAPLYTVDMIRSTPYEYNNLSKELVNRWRRPGDHLTTNIPSLPQTTVPLLSIPSGALTFGDQLQGASESPFTLYNFSTARVVNASYLRINNLMLNYALPANVAKFIFTKAATLGYSVNNLYTFVSKDFKGVDAEVASGSQPLPRIHAFNLSVTF